MVATINTVARERRAVLAALARVIRTADTALEAVARRVKQLSSNRRKIPEQTDFLKVMQLLKILDQSVDSVLTSASAAQKAFLSVG
jgi:hypothetical protein